MQDYMPEATLRHAAWMGGAVLARVCFSQVGAVPLGWAAAVAASSLGCGCWGAVVRLSSGALAVFVGMQRPLVWLQGGCCVRYHSRPLVGPLHTGMPNKQVLPCPFRPPGFSLAAF